MLNVRAREAIQRAVHPLARAIARTGLSANALTLIGLAGTVAAAGLIATGRFGIGAALFIPFVALDLFDGLVARLRGTAGRWGAFVDSASDRVGDAAILGAIAWHLRVGEPRGSAAALSALVLSSLISYVKARAESLGYRCEGGFAERGERMILVGIGLLLGIMEIALWVLVGLAAVTLGQRVLMVRRQAAADRAASSESAPPG